MRKYIVFGLLLLFLLLGANAFAGVEQVLLVEVFSTDNEAIIQRSNGTSPHFSQTTELMTEEDSCG